MYEFKLPDLGEGIAEGELLKWYVKEGDTIGEDDNLMDVETDKAAVTIPSPVAGTVVRLNGRVGDTINVGAVVVVIDTGGNGAAVRVSALAAAEPAASKPTAMKAAQTTQTVETALSVADTAATAPPGVMHKPGRPVPAAPATRRIARELGLDINTIPGTGPGGRVTERDVRGFAPGGVGAPVHPAGSAAAVQAKTPPVASVPLPPAAEPAEFGEAGGIPFYELEPMPDFEAEGPVEREALRSIRRKVAKKLATSMILVPHVAHMDEADVTELEGFRNRERKRREDAAGAKLTLLPFVMRALVAMLKKYPQFNASLDPFRNEIVTKKYYNVGFATDTPRGLLVPVVKDVDRKSIIQVSGEIVALATKARDGSIEAGELRHGTITITNVGPIGGTGLIPTINYPEVAILGMGRTQEKPVVRNGEIVIRKMLPLTLCFDHRVADGAQAAYLMTELVKLLSDPHHLLLEA